jgi:hypothetical protein
MRRTRTPRAADKSLDRKDVHHGSSNSHREQLSPVLSKQFSEVALIHRALELAALDIRAHGGAKRPAISSTLVPWYSAPGPHAAGIVIRPMTATPKIAPCCCLCWIDGVRSKPIDNWPGAPVCREHLAAAIVRTGGHAVITPSLGFATAPAMLQ